jgi:hypothetical protein
MADEKAHMVAMQGMQRDGMGKEVKENQMDLTDIVGEVRTLAEIVDKLAIDSNRLILKVRSLERAESRKLGTVCHNLAVAITDKAVSAACEAQQAAFWPGKERDAMYAAIAAALRELGISALPA